MGSLSIWHWLVVLFLVGGVFIVPAWRIVAKAGFPGALSLLLLVPYVNLAAIWLFAFVKWPIEKQGA